MMKPSPVIPQSWRLLPVAIGVPVGGMTGIAASATALSVTVPLSPAPSVPVPVSVPVPESVVTVPESWFVTPVSATVLSVPLSTTDPESCPPRLESALTPLSVVVTGLDPLEPPLQPDQIEASTTAETSEKSAERLNMRGPPTKLVSSRATGCELLARPASGARQSAPPDPWRKTCPSSPEWAG